MHNQPFSRFQSADTGHSERSHSPQWRLWAVQSFVCLVLFVIAARVVTLQVTLRQRFLDVWSESTETEEFLSARSGRILSRDGAVLAYDERRYDLAVDYRWLESPPDQQWLQREISRRLGARDRRDEAKRSTVERQILQERDRLFEQLAQLTKTSREELESDARATQLKIEQMVADVEERRLQRNLESFKVQQLNWKDGIWGIVETIRQELTTPPRRYADDPIILKEELQPHILIEGVPLEVAAAIESRPHEFHGVHVKTRSARIYPLDDVAAHVIGVRRLPRLNEETTGQGGVEETYHDQLSGRSGRRLNVRNRRGDIIESTVIAEPQDGKEVVLTIDSQIQETSERLLDQRVVQSSTSLDQETLASGGVIIVMDLWTGDVLSMAASPRISPQVQVNPTIEEWREMLARENQPFFPRATRMALSPGSVFTLVTAIAALEEGVIGPDDLQECQGFLHHPDHYRCQQYLQTGHGHGVLRLEEAVCQSCNVFFFHLAERLGIERLTNWADAFGFGTPTGIDLPSEVAGQVVSPSLQQAEKTIQKRAALQMAIGQGELLVSPLQIVRLMATIGNGGYLVTPQIVHKQGGVTRTSSEMERVPGLSRETLKVIQRGMEMVVQHPLGTGVEAMTPAMTIAGKTGTAQASGKKSHAWMGGFVPANAPRFAFVVVLEHGGSGTADAAPIVAELMTELIGLGYLRPQWEDSSSFRENNSDAVSIDSDHAPSPR
ncbi:Stage V sporulation protein D [Thalassoglobus neptunius]|uniref:beta-lactamase n=1 Tax=Thalassoglobus neptunius TaxID=1938619 RepID=A0A5C5X8A0_9PLAN|nr:penicillin-binding transpeptidase domain-containing protein [Thalassoglobus neptunius]TWT58092.1 Stage V sporulation protein D [Thalassoglobus neptunius]